jgi:hypothetical protein
MDPNAFFGAFISALIAAIPAQAGVVCDRRGFCVEQPQFRPIPPPVYLDPYRVTPYDRAPPYREASPTPPRLNGPMTKDPQEAKLRDMIVAFCQQQPDEPFCRELHVWFERHPEAKQ